MKELLLIFCLLAFVSCGDINNGNGLGQDVSFGKSDIVNGTNLTPNDPFYHYSVSLNVRSGESMCSGFLYDRRTVVTAAHCVDKGAVHSVTFGSVLGYRETYSVDPAKVFPHEKYSNYDSTSHNGVPRYDIGLIILDKDAPDWMSNVKIKNFGELRPGNRVAFAGYGVTYTPGEPSGILRKGEGKILKTSLDTAEIYILDGCSQANRGDSGGPLFYEEENGSYTAIGIAAWITYANGRTGSGLYCVFKVSVFTDLNSYLPWIRNKVSLFN